MPKIHVEHIEYHRNGISGESFWSVSFTHKEDGRTRRMIGIVFDYDKYPGDYPDFYNPRTAVLDRDHLVPEGESEGPFSPNGILRFRGDNFNQALREAIRDALAAYDANRLPATA